MTRPSGGRLTLAERDELAHKAYDLSLEGCSAREIGRMLDVSHHTAAALVKEEASKRAAERPDRRQQVLDSLRRAVKRVWEELNSDRPSSHATAQLSNALVALLAEYNRVEGLHAPTRVDARVDARLTVQQESYVGNLAAGPLEAVSMILEAGAAGEDGEDALKEVVRRYEAGELASPIYVSSADLLDLCPTKTSGG